MLTPQPLYFRIILTFEEKSDIDLIQTKCEDSNMIRKSYKGRVMYTLTKKECERLFKAEKEAKKNTYPDANSGFAVALMTKKGNVYTGVSYISDTDTLTMHSEATALAHAAIHGEKEVLAITGPNCHICKQLIYESSLRSGIDVVIIFKENGKIKQIPISEMMPYPWPKRSFQKKLEKIKDEKFKKRGEMNV